jgi:hypothetical protein
MTKKKQKQDLIDMMADDEKDGLYQALTETEPSMEEVLLAVRTSWGRGSLDMVDNIGSRKEALKDCEALLVQVAEDKGASSRAAMDVLRKHFNERYSYCQEMDYGVVTCEKGTCFCRGECDFDTWAESLITLGPSELDF